MACLKKTGSFFQSLVFLRSLSVFDVVETYNLLLARSISDYVPNCTL